MRIPHPHRSHLRRRPQARALGGRCLRLAGALTVSVLIGGCATRSTRVQELHAMSPMLGLVASERSLIGAHELGLAASGTLFDALQRLRPEMVRLRPPSGSDPSWASPSVYVNGTLMGGTTELHRMTTTGVTQVRYLSSHETAFWLGRTHRGGALLITIK